MARPLRRRPPGPSRVEAAYVRDLRALDRAMVEVVRRFLGARLERAARLEARQDVDPIAFAGLDWGLLRIRLGRIADRGARLVDAQGRRIRDWNTRAMSDLLRIDLGREPPAVASLLEAWRRENVALISSIADRLHGDVQEVVSEATRKGTRVETLAGHLAERYGVSASRAELIARDQTLKANANLTQVRQAEAGVTRYLWSTSRDERVRPMHKDLEGTIHRWDDPPITNDRGDRNHPGGDYQCRCVAVPVLED